MNPKRPRTPILVTLLAVLFGAGASGAGAEGGRGSATPNRPGAILLVTVDTLRADAVAFDGGPPETTPFLAGLARDGVRFERSYATSSWTPPSMASLFTGVHGTTHGVVSGEISEERVLRQPILPGSLTTLAEAARAAGYVTIGVSSSRHLTRDLGFAQGFDRFADPASFLGGAAVNQIVRDLLREQFGDAWATAWRERPLFLWIHYFDPHDPYVPYEPWLEAHAPEALRRRPDSPARKVMRDLRRLFPAPDAALADAIRPIYRSEVARTDDFLAQLWRELAPDDDTLLILTADHGEEIVDHGSIGHSQSLYEELVRVPLLVRWPRGGFRAGARVEVPVSGIDLLPTLLDLLDRPIPRGLPGRTLRPLLENGRGGDRPIFLELHPPKPAAFAVRDGDFKLILHADDPGAAELYDLGRDPGERRNLAPAEGRRVEKMNGQIRRWLRSLPKAPDRGYRDTNDQELLEQLKALGYIDG